jgi:cytochrome P450
MTLASGLDLPYIDLADPSYQRDPSSWYRELIEQTWVVRVPQGFGVLTFDDADQILRHPDVSIYFDFPKEHSPFLNERAQRFILSLSGEEHSRVRRLARVAFTGREIERWRAHIQRTFRDLVDAVDVAGRCDFAQDISDPYPVLVTAPVLGIPVEDSVRLAPYSDDIITIFDAPRQAQNAARIEHAWRELEAALDEVVTTRRRNPGDDLVTKLIRAEDEGERLSHDELVMLLVALFVGGIDTTRHQLTLAMLSFIEEPQQWQLLADDTALVPQAIEETLRYNSTIHTVGRVARTDIEHRGVRFPAGSTIMVFVRSANRDPRRHEGADEFDITRRAEHLSFGAGPHFCVGAALARAELAEAFTALPRRWSHVELDGDPAFLPVTGNYGATSLPIRFHPRR